MNTSIKNVIIGTVAAFLCGGILIYAIEENKSVVQILAGFLIFIFPFTFLSVFKSKVGAFAFVFASIMITYFVSKFLFYDFWFGVLLAGIIGGSAFYFRVNPYKPFSPTEYRKKLQNESDNKI